MIEIGSGFSSLLTADVNRRFLGGALDFTCIEPFPRQFLRNGVPGITRLIVERVQDGVPARAARGSEPGDILVIDSSHVTKTGSDVNHIYFNVLPRLAPGVHVHIHDIFLPYDYPEQWVREGRSWNEQYILQAMLTHTRAWSILFSTRYAWWTLRDELAQTLGGTAIPGHSIWFTRTGPVDRRSPLIGRRPPGPEPGSESASPGSSAARRDEPPSGGPRATAQPLTFPTDAAWHGRRAPAAPTNSPPPLAHLVLTGPGAVRGNHYHRRGTEVALVLGPALVRVRDTDGLRDHEVAAGQAVRFTFPPGVPHAMLNTGSQPLIILSFNTEAHDPAHPDVVREVLIENA